MEPLAEKMDILTSGKTKKREIIIYSSLLSIDQLKKYIDTLKNDINEKEIKEGKEQYNTKVRQYKERKQQEQRQQEQRQQEQERRQNEALKQSQKETRQLKSERLKLQQEKERRQTEEEEQKREEEKFKNKYRDIINSQMFNIYNLNQSSDKLVEIKKEVNKKYRTYSIQVHPDRCTKTLHDFCTETFKILNEAHESIIKKIDKLINQE